ncbi:D-alanyl-D-alanine carboxypeptidase family protein [Xanthobacter pseudotagetidis]|uniref:D-alanyl-D-alanine carboxypeptidase family protein n=1 Tax=Xanthobacter pseudotagetidis TaxID=3119911 RepID=UPI00372C65B6
MARTTFLSPATRTLAAFRLMRTFTAFGLLCAFSAFGLMCTALALASPARAHPYLLVEADSGRVIEQQNAGAPWYPASVTKLMTVYVALSAVKDGRVTMDTPFTVSALAASQQPSKMGFQPGTKLTLDNALKMLMVKSANDIAVVIAEGVGGSMPAFVQEMNATAQRLGMNGTHYENPNGLPDPDQVTTARDLAILARAIIYHFPEHEMLFRIPAIRFGKILLRNYNRLIDRYPGADGMKTGFICASGFNLVATATRGGKRLIAVVLGASSAVGRNEEAAVLFEKGFQHTWSIFGGGASLASLQNAGGPPTDMRDVVCNAKRRGTAAENEDELVGAQNDGGSPFSFASPVQYSGAVLLQQQLPPSMPPVQVYVGVKGAPADPQSAIASNKPRKKPAVQEASRSTDGAGKPSAKPAAKPDAKAAAAKKKPVDTASAPVTAGAAPTAKPKPKPKAPETQAAPLPPSKPQG